ncbi:MAG TPA: winged helix DNA-binding domain-containing protein [Candidatus Dormibacteraeota bacterium]
MSERVLSTRELNRALLARQLLLKRSKLSLTAALERLGGLQSQYAPSPYIGLWSRLAGFRRESLTRALEKRQAVQATLMRSTIHTVSAADFPVLTAGISGGRREWWLRIARHQIEGVDMEAVADLLRKRLANGACRATELRSLLADHGIPAIAWSGIGLWLDMVRVPPSGTWEQRRADLYGLAEDWLGPRRADEAEGRELLIRRYLGAFGPATPNDIAGWAGLPPTKIAPTAEKLSLRRFRDANGGRLLDLPGSTIPDAATPAPVRFLPTWDATLLVHARRTQILPERYRPLVFDTKTPHSFPTFLVDGDVAGKWRYESGRVRLEPFEPLPARVRRELDEEAKALAAFHG